MISFLCIIHALLYNIAAKSLLFKKILFLFLFKFVNKKGLNKLIVSVNTENPPCLVKLQNNVEKFNFFHAVFEVIC